MQDDSTFDALSKPRSFSLALGYEHNPILFGNKIFKKNQLFD